MLTGREKLNECLDGTGGHCRNRKIKPGNRLVLHMIDTAMQQAERPWQLGQQGALRRRTGEIDAQHGFAAGFRR